MIKFYHLSEYAQLLLIAALEDQIHNKNKDPRGFKVEFDAHGKKRFDYDTVVEVQESGWVNFYKGTEPYTPYDEVEEELNEPAFTESLNECEGVSYIIIKDEYLNQIGE